MADANELARQMAAQQRREQAEEAARAAAAAQAARMALKDEVRELGRSVYAALEARNFQGMRPIVLIKYNSILSREKRQHIAGWEIAHFQRSWKDANVDETVWLLAKGEFGVGTPYGVRKHTVDDPFLSQFLTHVRDGLHEFCKENDIWLGTG